MLPASAGANPTGDEPALIPVTGTGSGWEAPLGDIDVANLDAGLLVAGHARWDHDGDGVVFNETYGGQLWTPEAGMRMFDLPDELYWTPSFYVPTAISDTGMVAGTTSFRVTFVTAPWHWTPDRGLEFLPMPEEPTWTGSAVAISRNGETIAGTICRFSPRPRPCGAAAGLESRAVAWHGGVATELPTAGLFSEARGLDASGNVVVGASGGQQSALDAARWVDGVEQPLGRVGTSSVARFSSDDGSVAFGTATLTDEGPTVLVRWDQSGVPDVLTPPAGLSVANFSSINGPGTAAVGALAEKTSCIVTPDPACDWEPFVWTESDGFTILPEPERQDPPPGWIGYDRSQAVDVSDDGAVVLGEFDQGVRGPGSPPDLAFVWRAGAGVVLVNDIMRELGVEEPNFWDAIAISSDASWLLTGGTGHPDSTVLVARLDPCVGGFSEDASVKFGDEDSGVPNYARSDGCTVLDLVWAEAPFDSHGALVMAVRSVTAQWLRDGLLTEQEAAAILAAAARSDVGRPAGGQ